MFRVTYQNSALYCRDSRSVKHKLRELLDDTPGDTGIPIYMEASSWADTATIGEEWEYEDLSVSCVDEESI